MKKLLFAVSAFLLLPFVAVAQSSQCPIAAGHSVFCAPSLGITPTAAVPFQGVAYSQSFAAVGATGAITAVIVSGSATQNGLTFNVGSSMSITGTPTNGNQDSWTVKWTDTSGRVYQTPISLNAATFTTIAVTCPGLLPCAVKTSGTIQMMATAQWSVSGPDITPLATWACTGTGYSSISSTGLFTASGSAGTPNCTATFNGIVDDGGSGVTVTVSGTAPIFQTTSLTAANEYQAYSSSPGSCTGGIAPYTYALGTLTLQTGLSISSSTGTISGTPTASGTKTGTVTCTDSMSNTGTSSSLSLAVGTVSSVAVNLASNPIIANTSTNATATGTYSNGNVVNFQNAVGGAQPYSVQGVNLTSGTSVQFGTPVSTTTGDTAVVIMLSYTSAHACSAYSASVTSANETFNAATTALGIAVANTAPFYNCAQMFYAYNITGASNDQPTCGWSVTVGATCVIQYYHGMLTTDPRDQHATPTQAASVGSCTPTAVTTTAANEVLVEGCVPNSATAFTSASGFTPEYSQLQPSAIFYSDEVVNSIQTSIAPVSGFSPAAQGEVTLFATFKANAPGTGVSWGTSDATCATVNQNGLIVAQSVISPCTVTITGTFNPGSVAGTATLTVNPASVAPDTSYIVTPATPTIAIGGQQPFTATGYPSGSVCSSCSWSSSNPSVASMNSNVATGLAGGSTTITAQGSGISGSTTLTVSASGTTITATTCGATDINNAFSAVTAATTLVVIPAGNCTETTQATLTVPAGSTTLTIQGSTTVNCTGTPGQSNYTCAATDNTVLVDQYASSNSPIWNIVTGSASSVLRITGITFKGGTLATGYNKPDGFVKFTGSTQNLRFDHNHVTTLTYSQSDFGGGVSLYSTMNGVFDHNLFELSWQNNGIRYYPEQYGFNAWSQPTAWGTSNFIFVENNQFLNGFVNDCNQGGRQVLRYNTYGAVNDTTGDSGGMQTHQVGQGVASPDLGCRTVERYHNYATVVGGNNTEYTSHDNASGTGLSWGNTINPAGNVSGGYQYDIAIYLSGRTLGGNNCGDTGGPVGHCPAPPNGYGYAGTGSSGVSSAWDGNQVAVSGWPALAQPGRGQMDLLSGSNFPNILDSVTGTITWPHQYLEPVYVFMTNCNGCAGIVATQAFNGGQAAITNRDFYGPLSNNQVANTSTTSPFNGTVGTGFGTLANRPTTCTAGQGGTYATSPTGSYGVAYWATDANSGQGELYVCTSTNTWTGIYQPYTYPHPLDH